MKGSPRSQIRLRNLTHFQNFAPDNANDAAVTLGQLAADIAYQEAADAWFLVAASIASGIHPPHAEYEGRVAGACRKLARALDSHADAIDKATEAQAKNVEQAKHKAANK